MDLTPTNKEKRAIDNSEEHPTKIYMVFDEPILEVVQKVENDLKKEKEATSQALIIKEDITQHIIPY